MQNRQNGSTLSGFILGLLVGLGVALIVALVMTKTLPFSEKLGAQPNTEEQAGMMTDPNTALYGNKNAIKEGGEKKEVLSVSPMTSTGVTPSALPTNVAEEAKQDKGADKAVYYLQVGAFQKQSDAEASKAKLALLGYEARISERGGENGTLYRVRLGPFDKMDAVHQNQAKLVESNIQTSIIRAPK